MKNKLILVIATFLLTSVFAQNDDGFVAKSYVSTSFTAAIFPATYEINETSERFTPIKTEIAQAEKALSRDLMSLNKDKARQDDLIIHRRLMRFKRQYFGILNENGERELIINAYFYEKNNDPHKNEFLNERITAQDSTSKYWQVHYNMDKKMLHSLKVGEVQEGSKIDEPSAKKSDDKSLEKNRLDMKTVPVERIKKVERIKEPNGTESDSTKVK